MFNWHYLHGADVGITMPTVILAPGGHGALDWDVLANAPRWGRYNFLIRNLDKFRASGLNLVVLDSSVELNREIRHSAEHAKEFSLALHSIRNSFAGRLHLCLNSAAALSLTEVESLPTDKLALVSPVYPDHISSRHDNETLVLQHSSDTCCTSHHDKRNAYYALLANHFDHSVFSSLVLASDDFLGDDHECSGRSAHGFWGLINDIAVNTLVSYFNEKTL